jgi:hypothetical protein
MHWEEWNCVLNQLIEMTGRMSFLPVAGSLQSSKVDYRQSIQSEKHWDRLSLGQNVQAAVKRVLYSTVPQKMYWETFARHNEHQTPYFQTFDSIIAVRKYNGWFIAMFVNESGILEWQTMGGYVFKWIERLIQPFVDELQKIVTRELQRKAAGEKPLIDIDSCFKFEFTARYLNTDEECLQNMGLIDPSSVRYVLVLVDFFYGYTDKMDGELYQIMSRESHLGTKSKFKKMEAKDWRKYFVAHNNTVDQRIEQARQIINLDSRTNVDDSSKFASVNLEFAEIIITDLSHNPLHGLLHNIATRKIEGYVLHCTRKSGDQQSPYSGNEYKIFKLKLECFGGLGFFLDRQESFQNTSQPTIIDTSLKNQPRINTLTAGRHFVVNLLTVECLGGKNIPAFGGIGYWNPIIGKYVVTDRVIFKGVFKNKWNSVNKYAGINKEYLLAGNNVAESNLENTEYFAKHPTLTKFSRSMANFIAFCIHYYDSTRKSELTDSSNLEFTQTYLKDASPCYLNVSRLNLKIGGSVNSVYRTPTNNYHMMAAVLKCIGLEKETRLKCNAVDFTQFRDATQTLNVFIPENIKAWSIDDWSRNQELSELNNSKVLVWKTENESVIDPLTLDQTFFTGLQDYTEPGKNSEDILSLKNINVWCWDCFNTTAKTKDKVQYPLSMELLPYFRLTKMPSVSVSDVLNMIEHEVRVLNLAPDVLGEKTVNGKKEVVILNYKGTVAASKKNASNRTDHHLNRYNFYNPANGWPIDDDDILNQIDILFIPKAVWNCRGHTEGTAYEIRDQAGQVVQGGGKREFEELKKRLKHRCILVHETFIQNRMFSNFIWINEYVESYDSNGSSIPFDADNQPWYLDATQHRGNILHFLTQRQKERQARIEQLGDHLREELLKYSKKLFHQFESERAAVLSEAKAIQTKYRFKDKLTIDLWSESAPTTLSESETRQLPSKRRAETDERPAARPTSAPVHRSNLTHEIRREAELRNRRLLAEAHNHGLENDESTDDEENDELAFKRNHYVLQYPIFKLQGPRPLHNFSAFFDGDILNNSVINTMCGKLGLTRSFARDDATYRVLYSAKRKPKGDYILYSYLEMIRYLHLVDSQKNKGFENLQEKIAINAQYCKPENYIVTRKDDKLYYRETEITAENFDRIKHDSRGRFFVELRDFYQSIKKDLMHDMSTFMTTHLFYITFAQLMEPINHVFNTYMNARFAMQKELGKAQTWTIDDKKSFVTSQTGKDQLYDVGATLQTANLESGLLIHFDWPKKAAGKHHYFDDYFVLDPAISEYIINELMITRQMLQYTTEDVDEYEDTRTTVSHTGIVLVKDIEELYQKSRELKYNWKPGNPTKYMSRTDNPSFPPVIVYSIPPVLNAGLTEKSKVQYCTFPLIHLQCFKDWDQTEMCDERFYTFRLHAKSKHDGEYEFVFRCQINGFFHDIDSNEQALNFFQWAKGNQYSTTNAEFQRIFQRVTDTDTDVLFLGVPL